MTELTVLMDGIYFGEGPRWRDGHLWLSDFYAHEVLKVDLSLRAQHVELVEDDQAAIILTPDAYQGVLHDLDV